MLKQILPHQDNPKERDTTGYEQTEADYPAETSESFLLRYFWAMDVYSPR